MLRICVPSMLLLLLTACGGGGGGSTVQPLITSTCSNGASDYPTCTSPAPVTTTAAAVTIQFGASGRIDAVAGSAPFNVPLSLSDATTGLTARLVSGPSFATLDGFSVKVDASALPQAPATYSLVVSLIDQNGIERGRQAGSIEISAVTAVSKQMMLVNGATISVDLVGLDVSAPANAFQSGSALIQIRSTVDAQGNPSVLLSLSEASAVPLQLSASNNVTLSGLTRSQALDSRVRPLALSAGSAQTAGTGSSGRQFDCAAFAAQDSTSSVSGTTCAQVWAQYTVYVTCPSGTAGSTPAFEIEMPVRSQPQIVPQFSIELPTYTPTVCPFNTSPTIRTGKREIWSKLSAPSGWNQRTPSEWQDQLPVLLVHGFTLSGIGGGAGTWGDLGGMLTAVTLPSKGSLKPAVFEFQWNTNAAFEDVADELTDAIKWIKTKTGKKVIVLAHSFGGLLTRTAIQRLGAHADATSLTEWSGLVERLVTLGTPHSGVAPAGSALGGALPKGSDFVAGLTVYCWQITCDQAGTHYGNIPLPTVGGGYSSSIFNYSKNGKLIEYLADLASHPLPPGTPIDSFIGIARLPVYTGDALISFDGQRFSTSLETLQYSKLNQNFMRHVEASTDVQEQVLGALSALNRASALESPPPSLCHTSQFHCDYSEANIALEQIDHPTWLALQQGHILGPFLLGSANSLAPVVTGISPKAMIADGVARPISIFVSNSSLFSAVQYRRGNGNWQLLSLLPSNSLVNIDPGSSNGVIKFRVCRSVLQTSTNDCSSGDDTLAVTVASPIPVVNQAKPFNIIADGSPGPFAIIGENFSASNVVQFQSSLGDWVVSPAGISPPTSNRIDMSFDPKALGLVGAIAVRVCRSVEDIPAGCSKNAVSVLVFPSLSLSANNRPSLTLGPTSGVGIAIGQSFRITLNAADVDGNLSSIDLDWNDGSSNHVERVPVTGGQASAILSRPFNASGTISWSATAYDKLGSPSGTLRGSFTVTAANSAPALTLVSTSGASVVAGTPYSITLSATDVDGNLANIDVNWNDGTAVQRKVVSGSSSGSVTFTRTFSSARTINWSANAYDSAASNNTSNPKSGSFTVR